MATYGTSPNIPPPPYTAPPPYEATAPNIPPYTLDGPAQCPHSYYHNLQQSNPSNPVICTFNTTLNPLPTVQQCPRRRFLAVVPVYYNRQRVKRTAVSALAISIIIICVIIGVYFYQFHAIFHE